MARPDYTVRYPMGEKILNLELPNHVISSIVLIKINYLQREAGLMGFVATFFASMVPLFIITVVVLSHYLLLDYEF